MMDVDDNAPNPKDAIIFTRVSSKEQASNKGDDKNAKENIGDMVESSIDNRTSSNINEKLDISKFTTNDRNHYSHEMQEEICREYCKSHDLNVVKVVSMVGSAYKGSWKVISKIDDEMYEHGVKNLVVYSMSRFSRKVSDALTFLDENPDIKIMSVSEQFETDTAFGKHMLRMALSNAEYESNLISARLKDSIKHRKKLGSHIGRASYGYKIVDDKTNNGEPIKKLVIDQNEQKNINKIMFILGEENTKYNIKVYQEIADKFNKKNISYRGKKWKMVSIKGLYNKYKNLTNNKLNSLSI